MRSIPGVESRVADTALVERRRAQIVAAAVELFSHQGYYRTTMQDVARKAGVSAGLIYQYVREKDDVLLLALLSVLDSYRDEIPRALQGLADPLERWLAAVRAYCRVVDQRRPATVLAYRSTKSLSRDRREAVKQAELDSNRLIAACVRDCVAAGLFRPVQVELVTYQLVTFAHTWALKHWRLREVATLEQYVAQGVDFFAHALLTAAGWERFRALAGSAAGPGAAGGGEAAPGQERAPRRGAKAR